MNYEYKKYICTQTTLMETIDKYGVAIIPKILNKEECTMMNDGVWDYLEHVSQKFNKPIKRNIKDTWKQFFELYPKHGMLMQHFGIGHAKYCWDIRQNPKVVDVFSKLWKVKQDELISSFDGASFHIPHEVTNRGIYRGKNWLHTDQSYCRNDFECVQSWVTGYDVNEGDATLTVLEKSNQYHKDAAKHFKISNPSDWYILNEKELDWYNKKGCHQVCIKCKAGDMVFWDSRTIHSGRETSKDRKKANFRNVVYVCMTPKSLASESQISKRIYAFESFRTTNHWPHKVKLFPVNPRTYGKKLETFTEINKPTLTALGKKIVGY